MARWKINRIRQVPPKAGSDSDDAYAIHFDDGPEPQMAIEYAAGGGGKFASGSQARNAVTPYLDDEHPPRRLLVDSEGNVRPREEEPPVDEAQELRREVIRQSDQADEDFDEDGEYRPL